MKRYDNIIRQSNKKPKQKKEYIFVPKLLIFNSLSLFQFLYNK